ncbi:hypothetical protein NJ7G_0118 [Natrinema sp. J7-2]|nr:hypothetical protein NJ7G_0118 [Natrinema sp. J7-2]
MTGVSDGRELTATRHSKTRLREAAKHDRETKHVIIVSSQNGYIAVVLHRRGI